MAEMGKNTGDVKARLRVRCGFPRVRLRRAERLKRDAFLLARAEQHLLGDLLLLPSSSSVFLARAVAARELGIGVFFNVGGGRGFLRSLLRRRGIRITSRSVLCRVSSSGWRVGRARLGVFHATAFCFVVGISGLGNDGDLPSAARNQEKTRTNK
jgi:hypothetical protein